MLFGSEKKEKPASTKVKCHWLAGGRAAKGLPEANMVAVDKRGVPQKVKMQNKHKVSLQTSTCNVGVKKTDN